MECIYCGKQKNQGETVVYSFTSNTCVCRDCDPAGAKNNPTPKLITKDI